MFKNLAILAACTGVLAIAAPPERPLQVVTTNTLDFTGGTVHLNSTYGELNVESWDQPRVEVVVTRTAFRHPGEKEQQEGRQYLDRIKVTVQKAANGDIEVNTQFPGRNRLVKAIWGLGDFNLDYRIKVPRTANLAIRHGVGDMVLDGVAGDIDASVKTGDIVVQLPEPEKYAIDAKTSLGDVYSDFDGANHSSHWIGQKFEGGTGHTIRLRVAVGGISIQRVDAWPLATK